MEARALATNSPTRAQIFLGFFKLGVIAFGGVGPMVRHIVVEERRWLDDAEFAGMLGLCQALPGANVCNFAVMLGDRFAGPGGAVAALAGLLAAPLAILVAIASFFGSFARFSDVRAALFGATAAAAGVAVGTAVKMALNTRPGPVVLAIAAAAFSAMAILRLPLLAALAVLLPTSYVFCGGRR